VNVLKMEAYTQKAAKRSFAIVFLYLRTFKQAWV
jgi:hypothetical protein